MASTVYVLRSLCLLHSQEEFLMYFHWKSSFYIVVKKNHLQLFQLCIVRSRGKGPFIFFIYLSRFFGTTRWKTFLPSLNCSGTFMESNCSDVCISLWMLYSMILIYLPFFMPILLLKNTSLWIFANLCMSCEQRYWWPLF